MNDLNTIVTGYLQTRKNDGEACHRYASFDYCYNHFYPSKSRDAKFDMEKSCLAIGLYLASWGMYRGSGFLLKRTSAKYYEPLVKFIMKQEPSIWKVDVDTYPDNEGKILNIYNEVSKQLKIAEMGQKKHVTLVTKVMLGVFGIVPAFDDNFCTTFRNIYKGECGFSSLNEQSLMCINDFYKKNKSVIDRLSDKTYTIEFCSGKPTNLKYTKAKIIDMYGFEKARISN